MGIGCVSIFIGLTDLYGAQTGSFWITMSIGIFCLIVSIRSIHRGGGSPKKYTDEEVARAKEAMDRMYFQKHGFWPKADNKKDDT